MSEVESRFEVDVNHGIPLGFRHTEHESVFRDAGVVDQNIDLTEIFVHLLHDFCGFFEVSCVRSVSNALHAFGFNLLTSGFSVFVDDEISECDISALFCKLKRECFTDSACGAGDESGFSG